MGEIIRYSSTCEVRQDQTKKSIEAVVHDFEEKDRLTVIINKSVKLPMKWNGYLYEGRMAGLDFISNGPTISRTQTSSRG
jgi:hypothetical protein